MNLPFIYTVVRKLLFALIATPVAAKAIAWLITHNIITQAMLDNWLTWLAGAIVAVIVACWSEYIWPWILKHILKRPVTILTK